jgi:hypothetical protein
MRRLPALCFFLFGTLLMLPVRAAEWQLASHEPGLTLYTRTVAGQDLKDFRGVVRVQAPMRHVVQVLVDADSMPQWFFNMREARLLEINGKGNSFMYFVIKGLWPVSDRDAVVRLQLEQDAKTLALTFAATAVPEHYPPMRNRVRISRLLASWTITPVSATETDIRLDGHADPGGAIPVWMANLVVVELPRVTLKNLRKRLESPALDSAALNADPRIAKLLTDMKFPESP